MNFFGHAVFAARDRDDPAFVLGAMLPDLAAMCGARIAQADDLATADGLRHHIAMDDAFHAAPTFRHWVVDASRALRARGVARGAARGAAHVGPELLFDGWLAVSQGVPPSYEKALALGAAAGAPVRFRAHAANADPGCELARLCRRLAASPLPSAYDDADFAAERLVRILARRPRLAPTSTERRELGMWMREQRALVAADAPSLCDELARSADAREASPRPLS